MVGLETENSGSLQERGKYQVQSQLVPNQHTHELKVFVMYHGTPTWQQAESILDNGFYPSKHYSSMLGRGIYVSSTIQKTYGYGDITFKLLVYPGRICTITHQGHPRQKSWQSSFGSAWTPPNTYGMVKYQVIINNVHKFLYIILSVYNTSGKLHSK